MRTIAQATLTDVENNFNAVVEAMKSGRYRAVDLLDANRTLLFWIFAHHMMEEFVNKLDQTLSLLFDDRPTMLDAFWSLCKHYGYDLSKEDKLYLLQRL